MIFTSTIFNVPKIKKDFVKKSFGLCRKTKATLDLIILGGGFYCEKYKMDLKM